MSSQTSARVRLFGEFRNWSPAGEITISLSGAHSVSDVKKAVALELGKIHDREAIDSLMAVSALAGESRILLDSESLAELGMSAFALLPPVCGG